MNSARICRCSRNSGDNQDDRLSALISTLTAMCMQCVHVWRSAVAEESVFSLNRFLGGGGGEGDIHNRYCLMIPSTSLARTSPML